MKKKVYLLRKDKVCKLLRLKWQIFNILHENSGKNINLNLSPYRLKKTWGVFFRIWANLGAWLKETLFS